MKQTIQSIITTIICLYISTTIHSQTSTPRVTALKQQKVSRKDLPKGNYSGITHIKGDTFAIVSDKGTRMRLIKISQSKSTGKILTVSEIPTPSTDNKSTDCEDIAYNNKFNTLFITDESNQEIAEHTLDGKPTGRKLRIPNEMGKSHIQSNCGFEALAYDSTQNLYWTTTEAPLKADLAKVPAPLRLLCFNYNLTPIRQYTYFTEEPQLKGKARQYAFGVPAIMSLDNGKLLVMEREIRIKNNYIGSKAIIRLFIIEPTTNDTLTKTELASFTTHLKLGKTNLANYEGMCKGATLNDGRQTILLINDSQNRAGNPLLRLRDYIKVLILR